MTIVVKVLQTKQMGRSLPIAALDEILNALLSTSETSPVLPSLIDIQYMQLRTLGTVSLFPAYI